MNTNPPREDDAMLDRFTTRTTTWTDPSTGALGPAALDEALEAEIARARRYGAPLAAVVIDACGLDPRALLDLVVVVRASIRRSDVVGRDRAGRLVVLVPDAGLEAVRRIAAALPSRLVLSVGSASWLEGETPAQLLARATPDATRQIA